MVERIGLKQISVDTKPASRINPANNEPRDEKRKNFNRQLQKELNDKDKKQDKEEFRENVEKKLTDNDSKEEKDFERKKENKKEDEINSISGKIDIYI